MWKVFFLLKLFMIPCEAQNDLYPRHPDEVLREVSEPSAAALARRALRGLSISEVIKGVYPTLPKPANSPTSVRSEPSVERLPQPERLRETFDFTPPQPPVQAAAPQTATAPEVRLVRLSAPSQALSYRSDQAQALPGTQSQQSFGNRATTPPAFNSRTVLYPAQAPAVTPNVVDLNVLPGRFQGSIQREPERRIIRNRPAANINVVPVLQTSARRYVDGSSRSQANNDGVRPRTDSSDDYYESYEFGYEIRTPEGTHSHEERKIPTGQVFGSYSMALADGRQRLVTYSADGDGFHPTVETNELGTLTSEPADARIISTATVPNGEVSVEPVTPRGAFRRIRKIRKIKAKKTAT